MVYASCVFAPYTGRNSYTYLADKFPDVAVGDFAVVDTPTNGYQVVKVVGLPQDVDPNAFKYRPLLSVFKPEELS